MKTKVSNSLLSFVCTICVSFSLVFGGAGVSQAASKSSSKTVSDPIKYYAEQRLLNNYEVTPRNDNTRFYKEIDKIDGHFYASYMTCSTEKVYKYGSSKEVCFYIRRTNTAKRPNKFVTEAFFTGPVFDCSYDGCRLRVNFDDDHKTATKWYASHGREYDSLFLSNPVAYVTDLLRKNVKKLNSELIVYGDGSYVFPFDLSTFDAFKLLTDAEQADIKKRVEDKAKK